MPRSSLKERAGVKRAHKIPFNPVYAVELEPETRGKPLVWTPGQIARFLEFTADDRLACLWRFVVLRGFRRGEICALADTDVDTEGAKVTVSAALVQVRGRLVWGGRSRRPASGWWAWTKAASPPLGHTGRCASANAWPQVRRGRTPAGCSPTSSAGRCIPSTSPAGSANSRRQPGCRVIKFHAARHTAATLALEAGTDVRIVSEMLGHSTTRVTQDLYQHVRVQLQIDAAETAVELLSGHKGVRETGS